MQKSTWLTPQMFGMGSPVAAAASCSIYEGLR
jgi:hypothetical protein